MDISNNNIEVINLEDNVEMVDNSQKVKKANSVKPILKTHTDSNEKDKSKELKKETPAVAPEYKGYDDKLNEKNTNETSNSLLKLLGDSVGIGTGKPKVKPSEENKGGKTALEHEVLPLKERLAQRTKMGTIDAFMKVITDYTAKQPNLSPNKPSNVMIKNDEVIHNLLNKKRDFDEELSKTMEVEGSSKRPVRSATKKGKIIDDEEEKQEKKNNMDFDDLDLDFNF